MPIRIIVLLTFVTIFGGSVFAQTVDVQALDPIQRIAVEMTTVSKNVADLNKSLKDFVAKFEKVGGVSLSEKQQRLVFGLELLVRTEERVAILQKFQVDLTEKLGQNRARLAQIELDLRPESIDRSTNFEGSTRTVEIRENRRAALLAERASVSSLVSQIQQNLNEASEALREAQSLAYRLRRSLLPEIEREIISH